MRARYSRHRVSLRVDHAHAGRAVLALIVNDRMHDGVGVQGHVAGLRRPRERRRVRGEVGAERAAAPAQVARAAGAASLLQMDRLGLRQMSPSAAHHVTIAVVRADLVAHVLLDAVEVERRQEFPVGHRLDSVAGPAHADEALDVRVPRSDVLVADRPADPVAMTLRRRELVVAPALAGAAPHDRLAAHLVAADPVERLLLHVGMLGVLHEEVLHVFRGDHAHHRIVLDHLARQPTAVRELPGREIRGGIVLDVLDVAAALQYQRLQALLAQFLGGPAACDAGADDDGVESGGVRPSLAG